MSTTAPSASLTRMKVKPFGVRQSALLLKEYMVSSMPLLLRLVRFFKLDLLKSTAGVPLDSLKSSEGVVTQGVQTAAERHTTARSCPVWVIVIGIECSMEVEVLLNVDDGDVVLSEQLPNTSSVCLLVARNIVAV